MSLAIDDVIQSCNAISRQVKECYRQLTLHYIPHHEGQNAEAFALASQEIAMHPAARPAAHILGRTKTLDNGSGMIGIATARQTLFLGLASHTSMLALCTINIDRHGSLKEIRRHAWHMAWQAIDAMRLHDMREGEEGHGAGAQEVSVRRRTVQETAAANLRADTFSVLMAALQDDREAIRKTALMRSLDALRALPHQHPEYYPYMIAMDATEAAFKMLTSRNIPKRKMIDAVLRTADEIGKTFDSSTLRQWIAFSRPAQDMAWRGYNPEEILSAAINTSEDTYVRAVGYMISEITEIKPASILTIRENYSPFADEAFNEQLHNKAIDRLFADVVARGMQMNSARPFLDAANSQNNGLTEGRTVGWCAAALQAAAAAFESAARNDGEPAQEARRLFEGERARTPWESLKKLGAKIVQQYWQGHLVTLSALQEICGNEPTLIPIRKSVDMTIRDPSYQNSLQAVRELSAIPALAPVRPAITGPRGPQPSSPALYAGPGLGSGGKNGMAARSSTATSSAIPQNAEEKNDISDQ